MQSIVNNNIILSKQLYDITLWDPHISYMSQFTSLPSQWQ